MQFVTIEGADACGKSSIHRGYYDSEDETHVPGVVEELEQALDRPVYPSREPGRYRNEDRWWDPLGFLSVESHLDTALKWMGVAYTKARGAPQVRRVLEAAAFVQVHGATPTDIIGSCASGGTRPGVYIEEIQSATHDWDDLISLARADRTFRRRLSRYDGRDAIRHALIGARDSDQLRPTTSGLLFFAGHLLHARWLNTLPDDALVISDRAGESQLAFGRHRGDDPRVEELYLSERPVESDLVLLVCCAPDERKRRLQARTKAENKSWKQTAEAAESVHNNYLNLIDKLDVPFQTLDTTARDRDQSIHRARSLIHKQLNLGT